MKKKILFIASGILAVFLIALVCVLNYIPALPSMSPIIVDGYKGNEIKLSSSTATTQTNDQVVITATYEPQYVVDDTLNWSLEWVGTDSRKVTDYVTMTVSQDTHSVTIKYLKNFDKQILVKAVANTDATVSATCTIDCYQRYNDIEMYLKYSRYGVEKQLFGYGESSVQIDCSELTYDDLISNTFHLEVTEINETLYGTVETDFTYKMYFDLHQDLVQALDFRDYDGRQEIQIGNSFGTQYIDETFRLDLRDSDNLRGLSETSNWFQITIEYQVKSGETVIENGTLYFTLGNINIADQVNINSIKLNQSAVIF